jgi:hypothetical protein
MSKVYIKNMVAKDNLQRDTKSCPILESAGKQKERKTEKQPEKISD